MVFFIKQNTRNGWEIIRSGSLPGRTNKVINATLFLKGLQVAVRRCSQEIQSNEELLKIFCKKLDEICENCQKLRDAQLFKLAAALLCGKLIQNVSIKYKALEF